MKNVPLERWLLPNGLVVLYRCLPDVPLVAGTLLLRTGSWQETPEQAGLASFALELMLQGTTHRSPSQLAREIEFMGGSLGSQCSEDYSDLQIIAPSEETSKALDILSDVLRYPSFPKDEIVKERDHTLASLRSRSDTLFNVAYDALNKELFGDHAYGRLLDGTPETLKSFSRADVQAWHAKHIHPQGSVFSLVSPLPLAKVRKLIEKYLSPWKNPTPLLKSSSPAVSGRGPILSLLQTNSFMDSPREAAGNDKLKKNQKRGRRLELKASFEQAYLMIGMKAPSISEPGYRSLKILNTILGGGMSSRLFLELREHRGLAYEVASFFPTHLQPSQWVIYMGLPHEKLPTAEKEMTRLLKRVATQGVDAAELRQAKRMVVGSYLMEHQTRRRQAWYAAWWEFLGKEPGYEKEYLAEVDAVRLKDVSAIARQLLDEPRTTVVVTPK